MREELWQEFPAYVFRGPDQRRKAECPEWNSRGMASAGVQPLELPGGTLFPVRNCCAVLAEFGTGKGAEGCCAEVEGVKGVDLSADFWGEVLEGEGPRGSR